MASEKRKHASDKSKKPQNAYQRLLKTFNIDLDKEERHRKRRRVEELGELDEQDAEEPKKDQISEEDELDDQPDPEVGEEIEELSDGEDEAADAVAGDAFDIHFANPDTAQLEHKIKAISDGWNSQKIAFGKEKATFMGPKDVAESSDFKTPSTSRAVFKSRLLTAREEINTSLSSQEKTLSNYLFNFNDIFFAGRTPYNSGRLRKLTSLHILNHHLKLRDRIVKHNAKLSSGTDPDLEYRDQGFTRPKALFLLPTRNSAAKWVESLIDIMKPEQQENRKRFEDNYVAEAAEMPIERPDDFKELFEGNDDDMFRVGIKFTRKTIKFFAQFYNADVILASPLGLRRAIEAKEDSPDYDYLSSIEILVIDQADALLMQNLDHLTFILSHINLLPKSLHDCDISRVRDWYSDGHAKYLRQTILFAPYVTPELNSLSTRFMQNISGKLKYSPSYDGSPLKNTGLPIKQLFTRIASPDFKKDQDARFQYFTAEVLPWIQKTLPSMSNVEGFGTVVFIRSYFDYVRVRNFFMMDSAASHISWASITENLSPADAQLRRVRSHFLSGKISLLLYTGRAHHFYRYKIRGVRNVVFYQLPDDPAWYEEMVSSSGWLGANVQADRMASEDGRVRVMFSKWDGLRLERIVGTERVVGMVKGKAEGFEFS
jgi:U3 small nucleolar RNA-associated protein 25